MLRERSGISHVRVATGVRMDPMLVSPRRPALIADGLTLMSRLKG